METSSTKSSDNKWLVIGYGNALRGDDYFGLAVIQRFAEGDTGHLAQTIGVHQLVPELAEPISRADNVIFVDASSDISPYELRILDLKPSPVSDSQSLPAFSHLSVPQSLLADAQALYGRTPNAWLYTVGGSRFDFEESLSTPLAARVAEVVQLIAEQIRSSSICSTSKG